MVELISGLLVFSAIAVAVKSLRIYAAFALSLTAALFPFVVLALAVIGGAVYLLFFHQHK